MMELPKYAQIRKVEFMPEDFERTFSASQTYDSSQPLTSVQDDLVNQMVKDITNQIFNATVANW